MINEQMQEALKHVVDERKAAVVVIDMQNDFCDPEGATARYFFGDMTRNQSVAPPINEFLDAARAAGIPVVHVKTETTEETASQAQVNKAKALAALGIQDFLVTNMCGKGTWGAEFWGVEPAPGEPVVVKHWYSAFADTRLDLVLRTLEVQTVILCGVTANVCVESTARDALFRDYNVVVARDLVGWIPSDDAMAEATFNNLAIYFGYVCTSDDVLECWESRLAGVRPVAEAVSA